jgi:CheY-like chemotaxis protein
LTNEAPKLVPPILLVEDDENDVFLMRRAFSTAKVENPLLVADNGEQAMELLKQRGNNPTSMPCLLITDIKMPRIDGFELLVWLQTQPSFHAMPKLVISSSILEEDLAKSLQLGATAYFIKPPSFVALVQLVREWKVAFFDRALSTKSRAPSGS